MTRKMCSEKRVRKEREILKMKVKGRFVIQEKERRMEKVEFVGGKRKI